MPEQIQHVGEFTRELSDSPAIAVTRRTGPPDPPAVDDDYVDCTVDGRLVRYTPAQAHSVLRLAPPGNVAAVRLRAIPTAERGIAVDDAFFTDLSSIDNGAWLRRGVADTRGTVVALLAADLVADAAATLHDITGRPTHTIATEPEAAAVGAGTTPGMPPNTVVCDIGGGTIDLVGAGRAVTAAGAGEAITTAVARVLGIPRALAERVKRTPAVRVEGPHVAHEEDGRRLFLDSPATADAIGRLCTRGSAGLVPFSNKLAAEEWRSLRLAIKQETVAANIARAMLAFDEPPTALLLAGGGALDDELLRTVGESLRSDPGCGGKGQHRRRARPAVRGGVRARSSLCEGALVLAGSETRDDVVQPERKRLIELFVGARPWVTVGPPPVELGGVAEPFALHVVVSNLDHPLGSQRHERQVLARVPARTLVPAGRALRGFVGGPVPRVVVEGRHQGL